MPYLSNSYRFDVNPAVRRTVFNSQNTRQRKTHTNRSIVYSVERLFNDIEYTQFSTLINDTLEHGAAVSDIPYFIADYETTAPGRIIEGSYQANPIRSNLWRVSYQFEILKKEYSTEQLVYNQVNAAGGFQALSNALIASGFDSTVSGLVESLNSAAFVTTWRTDNPGGSANNQITIDVPSGSFNYRVDWGDGNVDDGVTTGITHTYATAGTYTVSITGDFAGFRFGTTDPQKLLSVEQWGNQVWQNLQSSFSGCVNLVINASDAPDLSSVFTMVNMFLNCSSLLTGLAAWNLSNVQILTGMFSNCALFNEDISGWDVSGVSNFNSMFNGASSFNQNIGNWNMIGAGNLSSMFAGTPFDQDIGGWNVVNVTNMGSMFSGGSGLSTANYDSLLTQWSGLTVQNGVNFDAGTSTYSASSQTSRDTLTNTFGWTITDGGVAP